MKKIGLIAFIAFTACNTSIKEEQNKNAVTINIKDSTTRNRITNAIDSLVQENSTPNDTTIDCKFIEQGKLNDDYFYLVVKMNNDKILKLKNGTLLKEDEISKLKKIGTNLTLSFNPADKIVKLLMEKYEQ